jgi:hypothetical protein
LYTKILRCGNTLQVRRSYLTLIVDGAPDKMIEEEEKHQESVMGEDRTKGRIEDVTPNNPEHSMNGEESEPGFFGALNAGEYLHKL